MIYNNYHKHTYYSNISTPDCIISIEDIAKRAIEIGGNILSTCEHGYAGNMFEYYDVAKKYGLKFVYAIEYYYVDDRFAKDRSNTHLMVLAKNKYGMRQMNRILSESNKTGYYYKNRIDKELLLSLNPEDVFVTSTCVMSYVGKFSKYEDEFIIPLMNHFGDNFYLEIHDNEHKMQVNYNKKILDLHNKYNIPLIHATDTHYIHPEDDKYRTMFLNGKNIYYPEEDGFIMDYPDSNTIFERYDKQGVFTKQQIKDSLNNTLIIDDFEDIHLDKTSIKMPSMYPNSTHKEKMKKLKTILNDEWKKDREEIPKEDYKKHIDAIKFETKIIEETKMEDYFLLNYEFTKKAKDKGGVLTRTGRGCFTEDALVFTMNGFKKIKDVKIGDKVINMTGEIDTVINTFKYNINEELVKIDYLFNSNKHFPNICTKDHKILVMNKNGKPKYKEAGKLLEEDYICLPKVKYENDYENEVVDLSEYIDNTSKTHYEVDNEYIYEKRPTGKRFKYSSKDVADKTGVSKFTTQKYAKGKTVGKRDATIKERIEGYLPFNSQREYVKYVEENAYDIVKIKRFIELDELFYKFIGMMYGDGFTNVNRGQLGLAINNSSNHHKNEINRNVFMGIINKLNLIKNHNENISKTKNLSQLYINSSLFLNFFTHRYFQSKKGLDKTINKDEFLSINKSNLKAFYDGLMLADGSNSRELHKSSDKANRISFDNTSKELIAIIKYCNMIFDNVPYSFNHRPSRIDSRGYNCKESYKLKRRIDTKAVKKSHNFLEDGDYWYLPIRKIQVINKIKTTVYDLQVKNNPSFLINNMIVHNSAPSFYINKLLGFTEIDRVDAPITLYPTRFMSKSRILETGSLPDIDFNTANPEPFVESAKETLGDDNVYYMIAYGTMQKSEAFRNLCRAKGMKQGEFNDVAKDLDKYANHKKWKELIEESKRFIGVIDSASPHPCAFLLLDKPISEEIGLMRVGDSKSFEHCAIIDSGTSDDWNYLKNDWLTVTVWQIISETFKLIRKPIPSIRELNELIENDEKVWKLYEEGLTSTLNQAGTDSAIPQVMRYKPTNVSELSAWVSAIRPSFASMKHIFLDRKPFSYEIDEFDKILSESSNFVLYQENIMATLVFAGFPEDETYGLLKAISKKKQGIVEPIRERFINGFKEKTGSEEKAEKVWKIIEDAVGYGFNSSHALSVAYDSIYGAYLKANYPLEYFTVILNKYENSTDTTSKIYSELDRFNIKVKPIQFGKSKATYSFEKQTNSIFKGIRSIKYLNKKIADELFSLSKNKYSNFIDLVVDITEKTSVDSRQMDILIKLNFFQEFGKNKSLLDIYNKFKDRYKKTYVKKTKEKRIEEINEYVNNTDMNQLMSPYHQISFEKEYMGYISTRYKHYDEKICAIIDVDKKYKPKLFLYNFKTGRQFMLKVDKKKFYDSRGMDNLYIGDIVKIKKTSEQPKWKKNDEGKWVQDESITETHLEQVDLIERNVGFD